ncbi:MAG TPA: ATP-binding protein [Oceanospirillales bacterium]|nr:ATP-binding protein [Oceanospirillales bacterium]
MYKREISKDIIASFDSREVVFLLGTRQTGKTTLSKLLAQESQYSQSNTYYFDFEDRHYRNMFNDVSIEILKQLLNIEGINLTQKNLLIFDEIQLLDDPSNLLKLLHDHFPNLKIIATGSSSLQIKSKFSDSLAGRKRVYLIEPLNFDEFLLFRGENKLINLRKLLINKEIDSNSIKILQPYHQHFLNLLTEYIIYGGYPEVVLSLDNKSKIEKLDSIASAYIQRDIGEIANIENLSAYNKLLEYLAINAGCQFKLSSAQQAIGITAKTLSKYLNILQETFIISELRPFYTNKNKEISKTSKIFFKDSGINNLMIKNFNPLELRRDAGSLYETYVFNKLQYNRPVNSSLYFYRTQSKSEIDFIQVENAQYSLYEVKSGKSAKIPRAMTEFNKKYKEQIMIKNKYVINQSTYLQKGEVKFIPAYLL